MIYFTSDQHFGHKNILTFCKRPFADVVEMREGLLNAINRRVGQSDELWFLGDFGLHLRTEDVKDHLRRIICKRTRLVLGNHDQRQHAQCFEQFYEAHKLRFNHKSFYLSHYPLRSWRADYQLHGHEHGTMKPMVGQLDVGVDNRSWPEFNKELFGTPWSLEEVIQYVQQRDKEYIIQNACQSKHGDRLIVGGYGGRTTSADMAGDVARRVE